MFKNLIFFLFFNLIYAQSNYVDFFLLNYNPQEGDFIFQDLDSSPLCDAIEEVTPGIFNQNFSHVGIIIKENNSFRILEAFINGVKSVSLKEFISRSFDKTGVPKITIARIHPTYLKENPYLIDDAIKKSKGLLNKPYDTNFLMDKNSFYCSEFIYEIFNTKNEFFKLAPMTYKNSKGSFQQTWVDYFKHLNAKIPEGEPGINPGKMTLNKNLQFIYNYKNPYDFN